LYISISNQVFEHDLPGRYALEPNHTHYIFFDDGTYNSTDNGEFASKLAREISYGARRRGQFFSNEIANHHSSYKYIYLFDLVPLVTILVGGSLFGLRSIWVDLINQVPVAIVDVSDEEVW